MSDASGWILLIGFAGACTAISGVVYANRIAVRRMLRGASRQRRQCWTGLVCLIGVASTAVCVMSAVWKGDAGVSDGLARIRLGLGTVLFLAAVIGAGSGLYHMAGNAWQWCADWFDMGAYERFRTGDLTAVPSGEYRVLRGGSWRRAAQANFRCWNRFCALPDRRCDSVGFRVALDASPELPPPAVASVPVGSGSDDRADDQRPARVSPSPLTVPATEPRATREDRPPLVFISAKSDDYPYARQYHEYLTAHGVRVFLSSESLPELGTADYRAAIDKALDEAKHMIVVTSSPDHVRSPWVEAEWGLFVNEKRSGRKSGNLLTVLLGNMRIDDLPASLRYYEVIRDSPESFATLMRYVSR